MLEYLVRGKAQREIFRLIWGKQAAGSVSALSRLAGVSFSAVYRELESMRAADLVLCERVGTELQYRAKTDHPQKELLRQLACDAAVTAAGNQRSDDEHVRSWLASVGAPLGAPEPEMAAPALEETLAKGVELSHRDATVARVLPVALWRQRKHVNLDRLVLEATRRDERQALGYLLELAGLFGGDSTLVKAARRLKDKRRTKARMYFHGQHGHHTFALTLRNTPAKAREWGFLMNMDLDSFRSTFEKFVEAR